jgi:hypothetical protein
MSAHTKATAACPLHCYNRLRESGGWKPAIPGMPRLPRSKALQELKSPVLLHSKQDPYAPCIAPSPSFPPKDPQSTARPGLVGPSQAEGL